METAFWALVHTILPEEARKHLKAATREQLLAELPVPGVHRVRAVERDPGDAVPAEDGLEDRVVAHVGQRGSVQICSALRIRAD